MEGHAARILTAPWRIELTLSILPWRLGLPRERHDERNPIPNIHNPKEAQWQARQARFGQVH